MSQRVLGEPPQRSGSLVVSGVVSSMSDCVSAALATLLSVTRRAGEKRVLADIKRLKNLELLVTVFCFHSFLNIYNNFK